MFSVLIFANICRETWISQVPVSSKNVPSTISLHSLPVLLDCLSDWVSLGPRLDILQALVFCSIHPDLC